MMSSGLLATITAFFGTASAASVFAGFANHAAVDFGKEVSSRNLRFKTSSSMTAMSGIKKPPRVFRKGQIEGGKKKKKEADKVEGIFECGMTYQTNYYSNKAHKCPTACPYFAQNKNDDLFCSFVCVPNAMECIQNNPKTTIADKERGICRKPMIQYCDEYNYDGTDTCFVCSSGYKLMPDGTCAYKYMHIIIGIAIFGGVLGIFVAVWVVDMVIRPLTNAQGLADGLAHRSREKLRQPRVFNDAGEPSKGDRPNFPLMTNMCRDGTVCGPGMLLHFNFQAALIVWAFLVAITWVIIAATVDHALFILGTRSYGTPRDNCILVAWGYRTQQDLMWTKILFLEIVYAITFLGSIIHGIRQLRMFQSYDFETKTMKDFVLMCENCPVKQGKTNPGKEFQKLVEDKLSDVTISPSSDRKVKVVGVSVAWDFADQSEDILKFCWEDVSAIEQADMDGLMEPEGEEWAKKDYTNTSVEQDYKKDDMNPVRKFFYWIENAIFGLDEEEPEDTVVEFEPNEIGITTNSDGIVTGLSDDGQAKQKGVKVGWTMKKINDDTYTKDLFDKAEKSTEKFNVAFDATPDIKVVLEEMNSTPVCFVVFQTEKGKEAAYQKMKEDPVMWDEQQIVVKTIEYEPDTVRWENIGHDSGAAQAGRFALGCLAIFMGLVFWTVCFYGPYAWSISNFNYDNGQEPGFAYSFSFSMVVVVGNAIMYEICARVADYVGFRFYDKREACYMICYTIACLFNVLLDFVCTYFVAKQIMVELGFRTYYGKKLEDVKGFTAQFETYAMQRTLAENTYAYAFPSTFLIPFLLEPMITIYVPIKLSILLIRSHKVIGRPAEEWCACIPMDMGRYADLLLNVILGLLIFYFPGGYTHSLFFGMFGSHIFIYYFDHYKVLRAIPSCTYASMEIDWWSQAMLAPCCALIVSCFVFKSTTGEYCQIKGYPCLQGPTLILTCTLAWIAHVVLHLIVLTFVVPLFGRKEEVSEEEDKDFEYVAKRNAASWFTTNPVHCLRSKHVYNDKPNPCTFRFAGKEHHLKVNKKIGCYFEDDAADAEDFTAMGGVPMKLKGKVDTPPNSERPSPKTPKAGV